MQKSRTIITENGGWTITYTSPTELVFFHLDRVYDAAWGDLVERQLVVINEANEKSDLERDAILAGTKPIQAQLDELHDLRSELGDFGRTLHEAGATRTVTEAANAFAAALEGWTARFPYAATLLLDSLKAEIAKGPLQSLKDLTPDRRWFDFEDFVSDEFVTISDND